MLFNTPTKIFDLPSFLQASLTGNRPVKASLQDLVTTNIESTSSFKFNSRGEALKSSQQLNVDWSQFENHCFLMSAEALVNITFDQIINGYPFDGTKKDIEDFFDQLTGFERWIFDQFPKYKGALHFQGTTSSYPSRLGNWIQVNDKAGILFPELSKNNSGKNILNSEDKSFSIETHFFIPQETNFLSVICQKINTTSNCGFTLYIDAASSITDPNLCFSLTSGSTYITTTAKISKGVYNHIVATIDKTKTSTSLLLFNNFQQIAQSSKQIVFEQLDFNNESLYIGSGSAWQQDNTSIIPLATLSGSLDEFRIFHSLRSVTDQELYHQKSITASDDLKLYFKFNEPPPLLVNDLSSSINAIVLDSSGNSLHSIIANFTGSLRINNENDPNSLMTYEHDDLSPVLFPAYADIMTLNQNLLHSASSYDIANPNIITKLIPEHWILQGQSYEGFNTQFGNIQNAYAGSGLPGQGEIGSTHLILSFLYIYARFFDECKIFIDQFENINHVSYDEFETVPNMFLTNLAKQSGLNLPPLFNDSSIEQYVYAENIDNQINTQELSLRTVQDELLKRTLINMPKLIKSKGTLYAVKAFLRTLGIDPENSVRIREFGGPTTKNLDFVREIKCEPNVMLQLTSASLVSSPFLSSLRIEPGEPKIAGIFSQPTDVYPNGVSNNRNDDLLTSGSWTFEANYKWLPNTINFTTQSLCRINVTGSNASEGGIVANLTAINATDGAILNLHLRPGSSPYSPYKKITLNLGTDEAIFNSEKWYISFGFNRPYENNSLLSGSYFLRASSQNFGQIDRLYQTSSNFYELSNVSGSSEINAFRQLGTNVFSGSTVYSNITTNASGTFIQFGQNVEIKSGSVLHETGSLYLNDIINVSNEARETHFSGLISNVRFWSRALTYNDFIEHSKNYKSTGCENPLIHFNFNSTSSGSFEKLRLNSVLNQDQRQALSTASIYHPTGTIILLDQTQNRFHLVGSGFEIEKDVLIGETFNYSYISPYFDESTTSENEKIRIRSAKSFDLVQQNTWTQWAPVFQTPSYERTTDNTNFAIEFSLIDSLNKDMITMFSTLESIGNIIGSPEMAYSVDYPGLSQLREIYFKQIQGTINFKSFFDFFQFFDVAIGTFIEQLLPRKTNFKGMNFILESHLLERHKVLYLSEEQYLIQSDRQRFKDILLLQQIAGSVNKY
jgi:hypothetical protein